VDAFAEGTVAMMINYSWQMEAIKNKNPKLNFAVSAVPQVYPDTPVNNANYEAFAVAKNKIASVPTTGGAPTTAPVSNDMRVHEAWQFLRYLTLNNAGVVTLYNAVTKNSLDFPVAFDPALDYLKKTQQPAARRDIIENQKSDINLGPFATGNLIAKHWYQVDPDSVDKIFVETIDSVNRGDVSLQEALSLAKNRINYLSGAGTGR
jgi:ABC-type glycerol-3-phosphate transport system substrate-binding protein